VRRRRIGWGGAVVALVALALFGRGPLHGLLFDRAPDAPDAPATAGDRAVAGSRVGPCEVLRVVDGDTLHVRVPGSPTPDEKIRMLRINTPEHDQPGFERATAALLALIDGKQVELEWEKPDAAERDEYGRLLAYVWVGETLTNLELVRQGWTRFFTKYGGGRYADRFRAAEDEARAAKRGLWTAEGWNVGARAPRRPRSGGR
jgi:micrococcal nuclease